MQRTNRPSVKLRADRLRVHARKLGITSDTALAVHIGVAPSTVVRMYKGDLAPGENFIAASLLAFPELRFEDLFKVTGRSGSRASAA